MSTQPWVEKYRPQVLKDVVGNEETVAKLQAVVNGGNMPNIILSGPPGTGKTTTMLCLARQLLGPLAKDAVMELNASDERGIAVVRDKIKMFAKKRVNTSGQQNCDPRRGRLHDGRRAASDEKDHGAVFIYH